MSRDATAEETVQAAVGFEMAIREVMALYMEQGLTVTGAIGTLELIKTEASLSFFVQTGRMDESLKQAFFKQGPMG